MVSRFYSYSGFGVDGTIPKFGGLYGAPSKRHIGVCAFCSETTVLDPIIRSLQFTLMNISGTKPCGSFQRAWLGTGRMVSVRIRRWPRIGGDGRGDWPRTAMIILKN